jgi:glycosyltransferase involved in cell wall biosynthesis
MAIRLARFSAALARHGRDADVLYVNDYGLPGMVANALLRKPLVMKFVGDFAWEYAVRHGMVPPDQPIERFQHSRHSVRVELLRSMQSAYARRAHRVIAPSRYVASYVDGWGVDPSRIRVVLNAVDNPTDDVAESRETLRAILGIEPRARSILCVARLTVWKGIDTVIAAVGRLAGEFPHLSMIVVGDGPDRPRLEALASTVAPGRVRFDGEVVHAAVARHLISADGFALCSGYEGRSHVLLEAMAVGVPVIASDVAGNRELVEHERTGLLVSYGDVDATAAAIRRILVDERLAHGLIGAARARLSMMTVHRMVDETLGVFEEAIAR